MKSNKELGYERVARVGNYEIGKKGKRWRAYGYEWRHERDISLEESHHEVCGRGENPLEAIERLISAAVAGAGIPARVHNQKKVRGLSNAEAETLRLELLEAIDEMTD